MENLKRIAHKIKAARNECGKTAEELAKDIGKSTSYLTLIENGQRRINLEVLAAIANALSKSMSYFVEESTPHQSFEQSLAEIIGINPEAIKPLPEEVKQAIATLLRPYINEESQTSTSPVIAQRKKRILIVDDEIGICKTLMQYLRGKGYDVIVAFDGQDALNIVRTAERFNLIVTDLKMRVVDGLAFIDTFREGNSSTPIIIMSAYPGEGAEAYFDEKADIKGYFQKPFSMEDLWQKIKEILGS